ncbi:hypothetical protein GCM10023231_27790 [Olivibacter ginsenosidimutans]|uniref:Outer membrane lipoprotein-sorting protein n=1 Tax=Olivibacter ginsenosidimutans TaxID=1176537 RepID=A0ABP9BM57_9SPHI
MSISYKQQIRWRLFFALCFSFTFTIPVFAQTKDQLLNLIWQGIGDRQSWEEARYFMFSCQTTWHQTVPGEHAYIWDRKTGNCRFEGATTHQDKLVVLFNTRNKKGKVFINNNLIAPKDSAQRFLQPVLDAFANDSFWLFFPQLLKDSASLKINGAELIGSARYYVVELPTPQQTTRIRHSKLFIDTNTGRIFQWQALSDNNEILFNLLTSGFKDVGGGLTLISAFRDTKSGIQINYPIISALINVEADKFLKP